MPAAWRTRAMAWFTPPRPSTRPTSRARLPDHTRPCIRVCVCVLAQVLVGASFMASAIHFWLPARGEHNHEAERVEGVYGSANSSFPIDMTMITSCEQGKCVRLPGLAGIPTSTRLCEGPVACQARQEHTIQGRFEHLPSQLFSPSKSTHLRKGPVVCQQFSIPPLADQLLAVANLLIQLGQVELA
eukprot:scaffold14369_cov19-Tisochrysis_lutea.AAC.2